MSEYRDLRYSVPGWWLVISLAATVYALDGYSMKEICNMKDWQLVIAIIGLLISGPALSFSINSLAYIFLSQRFWRGKDIENQCDEWVKIAQTTEIGGYTDNFHSTMGRRWSSALTSVHSFLGILIGFIFGVVIAKKSIVRPNLIFISLAILCFIHLVHAIKTRCETLKMEKIFRDNYRHKYEKEENAQNKK